MKPPPLVWFCIGVPLLTSAKDLTREQVEFFEKKVRPVLVNNCYRCHSKEASSLKGSLYLDSRSGVLSGGESGPAIIPGKPEQSLIFKAVSYQQGKLKMPPKTKLADKDIRILEAWIKMGAPDPRVDEVRGSPVKSISKRVESSGHFNQSINLTSQNLEASGPKAILIVS